MAQHDYNIANQTFPNTRSDINNALSAVASNNSGTAAPSTTFANQWFYETDTNLLQIRNEDNDAYITIAELDQSNDTVEYFKADSIRTALIEFTDGDDAITIADGGGVTIASGSLDVTGAGDTGGIININSSDTAGASTDNIGRINFVGNDSSSSASGTRAAIETEVTGNFGSTQMNFEVAASGAAATKIASFSPTGLDLADGDITLASGHGISFASTSDASGMSSELLDDYEEGTFSPAFSGTTSAPSGVNYSNRAGFYTKIGRQVYFSLYLVLASFSSAPSGTLIISALPFTSLNSTNNYSAVNFGYSNEFISTDAPQTGFIGPNASQITCIANQSSDARDDLRTSVNAGNLDGNEVVIISGHYLT